MTAYDRVDNASICTTLPKPCSLVSFSGPVGCMAACERTSRAQGDESAEIITNSQCHSGLFILISRTG